jgi:hypothetical protein
MVRAHRLSSPGALAALLAAVAPQAFAGTNAVVTMART